MFYRIFILVNTQLTVSYESPWIAFIGRYFHQLPSIDSTHQQLVKKGLGYETRQDGPMVDSIGAKSRKVLKLDGAIRDQCIKMQEEVLKIRKEMQQEADKSQKLLKKKITYLQRKLQKCEHLKDAIFKECEHKLYRVKTEKELEVKGLQLQMKTQYMSLSTAHAQGKNQEMEQAVAQLEAKYLDLLGNIKDSAWKQKENDQKVNRCLNLAPDYSHHSS
uniref:Uncharacterized protein n=1 Tax=Timema poppense TaxID=170557 RepID=A0A7R9DK18_TIMPO|nr:unnamed protein product [Timema poppensis]